MGGLFLVPIGLLVGMALSGIGCEVAILAGGTLAHGAIGALDDWLIVTKGNTTGSTPALRFVRSIEKHKRVGDSHTRKIDTKMTCSRRLQSDAMPAWFTYCNVQRELLGFPVFSLEYGLLSSLWFLCTQHG